MKKNQKLFVALALAGLASCGGGGSGDSADADAGTFPRGLAIASPVGVQDNSSVAALRIGRAVTGFGANSDYMAAIDDIEAVLDGTASFADTFDAQLFLSRPTLTNCFGPTLDYSDHPDGGSGSGNLPSGDLGIWKDTDDSGNACAAAQLDSQMAGVSARGVQALVVLAGMVNAANTAGVALPTAGTSIDLTDEMNALSVANVGFSTATLALDGDGETWSYQVSFTYTDPEFNAHDISITMKHDPGVDANHYEGVLTYQVDDEFSGGHCPSNDVTYNGSIYYNRTAETAMQLNARDGMYCGHGRSAALVTDADLDASGTFQVIDPDDTYDAGTGAGWANNFSILGAAFDPTSLEGDYTYAWQAGYGDSNSRIMSIGVNADATDGEAYYGFGDPVQSTDGTIGGFFCSWAGPGSTHTLHTYAQRQFIQYNAATSKFDVPGGGSDIVYAPTNSCTYEAAGFWYDRDLDTANDETDAQIQVYASGAPDGYMNLDLMEAVDTDGDGTATVGEKIAQRGFNQPAM